MPVKYPKTGKATGGTTTNSNSGATNYSSGWAPTTGSYGDAMVQRKEDNAQAAANNAATSAYNKQTGAEAQAAAQRQAAAAQTLTMPAWSSMGTSNGAGMAAGQTQGELANAEQAAANDAARASHPTFQSTLTNNGGKFSLFGSAPGVSGPNFGSFMDKPPDPTADESMGLNFAQPGAAEQYFSNTGGEYQQPWQSERFANYAEDKYKNGTPGVSNLSLEAYQKGMAGQPQLDADMSKYYENAKRRAAESIDQSMAARGLYSSSAATDRIGEAFTDLEAQRAKDEANYGLQRSGELRSWGQLGGTLSGQADDQSLAASNNERGWLESLGGLSSQADSSRLGRLQSGQSAANAAQDAQRSRGADFLGREMGMGSAMSGLSGEEYDKMLSGDQELLMQMLAAKLGVSAEELTGRRGETDRATAAGNAARDTAASAAGSIYNYFKGDEKK